MAIDRLLREADPVADWHVDPASAQAQVMLAETLATPRPGDAELSRPAPEGRRVGTRLGWRRRPVLVASTMTAVAAIAAVIGVAASGDTADGPVPPRPATLSGQELLLAAANTALRQPEGTGRYWHVKVVAKDAAPKTRNDGSFETWADRDGVNWIRFADRSHNPAPTPCNGRKPDPPSSGTPDPSNGGWVEPRQVPCGDFSPTTNKPSNEPSRWGDRGFSLLGVYITFVELQNLPTTPDALKASITTILNDNGADPTYMEERVLYGLVALVSQLPAPPTVRAAAFQAIAAYPGVVNLGPVDRGQALQIPAGPNPARLIIDPVAAQIRETAFLVVFNQTMQAGDGSSWVITAEWTDSLPK